MIPAAAKIIAELKLSPLPQEGGFFRQQWVSAEQRADGRAAASVIWFLITREGFSALHRVDAEERWEYHAGDGAEHVQLSGSGEVPRVTRLGGAGSAASARSVVVPAGAWQGARLANEGAAGGCGWALVSCLMRPAWREAGFELGEREALRREFPLAVDWVRALTR